MKTVLFVETGSGFGGSAICLDHLLRCLDQRRYRPIVAHLAEGLGIDRIKSRSVQTVRIHRGRAWWDVVQLIRRERVDLVHANNELYSHCATILAARWMRRPCVVHMRGIRALTRLERWLIRFVDQFIILSDFGRQYYLKEGIPAERAHVIYDGVDFSLFNGHVQAETVRRSLGLRPDEVVVGMVSRLDPMKGHQDFLAAIAQVIGTAPNVRAVIVGGDPQPNQSYFKQLRQWVRALGLADHVVFTGWRDDIPAMTAAFDIAVQASHYVEGFGTAVMEAMALGKSVVATRVGGIPELALQDQTALLVPAADAGALAEAITRLVQHPEERRRLGQAGRQRVEQVFDERRLVRKIERLYSQLLDEETS